MNNGYAIANISSLVALTSSQRIDGFALLVESDIGGFPAWYQFVAASTAVADNNLVLLPNDNPTSGRWLKLAQATIAGFATNLGCTTSCAGGGKTLQFFAPQSNAELIIVPGFGISITPGASAIKIYRWTTTPSVTTSGGVNTAVGLESSPIATLPNTGGTAVVNIDSGHKYISILALNAGVMDGVCFRIDGNVITLMSF